MTDYTDLQKAAAYAAQDTIKFADEAEEMRALQQFHEEVDPETVLALIAENERLQQREQDLSASVKYWFNACGGKQFEAGVKHADEAASQYIDEHWRRQRDQLKAENERLESEAVYAAAGFDAAREEVARLKAEIEALRDHLRLRVSEMPRDRLRETFNAAYYGPRELGSDGEQCRAGVLAVIDAAMGKGEQS